MRILLVAHGLPPSGLGGTELYVDALARRFAEAGDDVLVLAREATRARRELSIRRERRGGVEIAWINNTFSAVRSFAESYRNPRLAQVCAPLIAEYRPDVAHVHHLTCLSTEIPFELAARGVPILYTLHDYWLICHRGQLLDTQYRVCHGPFDGGCARCIGHAAAGPAIHAAAAALRRAERVVPRAASAARRMAASLGSRLPVDRERGRAESFDRLAHLRAMTTRIDRFLAPSAAVRDQHVRFGIPPGRIVLHEQGISSARPASRGPRTNGPLRIGFFGSLIPAKGIDVLLKAFRRLPAGAATLHLFGALAPYHDDRESMRGTAALLDWPGVEAPRLVPHDRVVEAMAALDVVAVPSIWPENAPFVIREAFAAGVPVVASAIGGIPEIVRHGVNGWLVEPGNVEALERTLRTLAADPECCRRLPAIDPPMMIDEDAARTRGHYEDLLRSRPVSRRRSTRVAAVVLNYRTPEETLLAVNAVRGSARPLDDIVVVDNGSLDGGESLRSRAGGSTVLEQTANLGYAGGVNVGIRHAVDRGAEAVLLLNSDVILPPDALGVLLHVFDEMPSAGIVAPLLVSRAEPDIVSSRGIRYSERTGRMVHLDHGRPVHVAAGRTEVVDAVSGCALLVRREVFDRIGLFDESYFFGYEDLDFCLRARDAGFLTCCTARAIAYHEGSVSIGPRSSSRVYYGTRNHLKLAASRSSSAAGRALRLVLVVVFNGAYVLRDPAVPLWSGLLALGQGLGDHLIGRYGPR